ncbi:MAG: DNA-binding HxlR family transcriptional regulator [Arenicella sp.]|jgi:DNA-binding HxlR family transcriptional regulator
MNELTTRASSINRALDQIGDKWCLLILQEVFWNVNTFTAMQEAMGVSRGVLASRLKWLQSIDCLQQLSERPGSKRMSYHLTQKSMDLYHNALTMLSWERQFHTSPELDNIELIHSVCGKQFSPETRCSRCSHSIEHQDVLYSPGPGATKDLREMKIRRRSTVSANDAPSQRNLYSNLVNIVGDRWTANVLALSFHGLRRFDEFRHALPIATNTLSDRLKYLVEQGIFEQHKYKANSSRYEYRLTQKGEATFPFFMTLLKWGDKWCDQKNKGRPMKLIHKCCGKSLVTEVVCGACGGILKAHEVKFDSASLAKHYESD